MVRRADQLNDLGRHEQALELVMPVLAADPAHVNAAVAAALALLNTDRPGEGVEVLRAALAANPHEPELLWLLSKAYVRTAQPEWAVWCASEAARIEPLDPTIRCQLSATLLVVGDREAAIHEARQAVELAPDLARTHLALAEALFPEGAKADRRSAEAEHHVRLALEIEPDSTYAHNELARISIGRGKQLTAASHLVDAVRSDPRERAVHANMDVVLGNVILWAHRGMLGLCVALGLTGLAGMMIGGEEPVALPLRLGVSVTAAGVVLGAMYLLVRLVLRRVSADLLRSFLRGFVRRDRLGALWGAFMLIQWLALLAACLLPPLGIAVAGLVGLHTLWIGAAISWLRILARK